MWGFREISKSCDDLRYQNIRKRTESPPHLKKDKHQNNSRKNETPPIIKKKMYNYSFYPWLSDFFIKTFVQQNCPNRLRELGFLSLKFQQNYHRSNREGAVKIDTGWKHDGAGGGLSIVHRNSPLLFLTSWIISIGFNCLSSSGQKSMAKESI